MDFFKDPEIYEDYVYVAGDAVIEYDGMNLQRILSQNSIDDAFVRRSSSVVSADSEDPSKQGAGVSPKFDSIL